MFKKLKKLTETVKSAAEAVTNAHEASVETEEIVQELAKYLVDQIIAKQGKIDIDAIHQSSGVRTYQIKSAARIAYRKFANNAWKDRHISDKERKQLTLLGRSLKLTDEEQQQIEVKIAEPIFVALIHECLTDHSLDSEEKARIKHIAANMGVPSHILVQRLMRSDARKILHQAFTPDFSLDLDEQISHLREIKTLCYELGFTDENLKDILALELQEVISFALTEAESDETSVLEEQKLIALVESIPLDPAIMTRLKDRIQFTAECGRIENGSQQLPQTTVDWINSKPGEIWHINTRGIQTKYSQRQGEISAQEIPGNCAISDLRIVFENPAEGISETSLRTIKSIRELNDHSCKVIPGRNPFDLELVDPKAMLALRILHQRSLGKGHSTTNERRRISKDVRQQVWARDGGLCVECGADDYLEYDHLIPVSKGGSNTPANIQLLCRRCNSEKSDSI